MEEKAKRRKVDSVHLDDAFSSKEKNRLWSAFKSAKNETKKENDVLWCDMENTLRDRKHSLFPSVESWAIAVDDEPQTFSDFMKMERYKITKKRNTIYLLPIGNEWSSMPGTTSDLLIEQFQQFCEVYFQLTVKTLPHLTVITSAKSSAKHPPEISVMDQQNEQVDWAYPISSIWSKDYKNVPRIYDMDILRVLKDFLPSDGYCIFGLTLMDIYEWEQDMTTKERAKEQADIQIMGRGTGDRVGIISLFRFDPHLEDKVNSKRTKALTYSKDDMKVWFLRTVKTMAHELMHTMGIDHCMYFSCCMNGCVAPDEEDEQLAISNKAHESRDPLFLCPIDLRKLREFANFDVVDRYQGLLSFFRKLDFPNEVAWLTKRMEQTSEYIMRNNDNKA